MVDIKNKNIRYITFNGLYEIFFEKKLLNVVLNDIFEDNNLDDKDKSFVRYECAGVIEKIDEIDKIINKFSKIKTNKLDKNILVILRIGVFEFLYMDKVPAYATINELVNLVKINFSDKNNINENIKTKTKTNKTQVNFVNAVLRNINRNFENKNCKSENIKYNCENKNNICEDKSEIANIVNKNNIFEEIPEVYNLNNFDNASNSNNTKNINENKYCYFRIYNNNENKVLDELNNKNIKYNPYDGDLEFKYAKVYRVHRYKNILELDNFKDGNILIQDVSSTYLTDKLAYFIKKYKKENETPDTVSMIKVLDVCASPGGKILGLIDLIYDDFYYFYAEARDISEDKILKICDNVNRLKVLDLNMLVKNASVYDELDKEKYDVIICDVPCSGLGVVNKKPDIKLNYSDDKLKSLIKLQKEILDVSSKYLKSGGIISYSTCTTTKYENELIIEEFLQNNINFNKLYEKRIELNDNNKSDGFYMCFLKKFKN